MATDEEVLGPRKTMIVLVIVVGCFAVLWPRILSPLLLGPAAQQLEPNQFDRDAGCCEVMFENEVAFLELVSAICQSSTGSDGKLSPYAAAECRKAVNETCGVDIAAFLKRNENVGKTTKMLLDTIKKSNSTCLRENFGVPVWSIGTHTALNSWKDVDTLKQERPLRGMGPHPALRERGRAIPPGAPTPPSRVPVPLPPHIRVRQSPLSGYFDIEIKPPPIPGMRPPLGSPGGPVQPPKSSMGFVMPIYTICIIVFFVYTLSKILFKRTGGPYESLPSDPHFRSQVFREHVRPTPEPKLVVTAISGLVAEVQQQMEASYAQSQQRQDVQDNHTRPYTNGNVVHNNAPVRIVASEYKEPIPELKEPSPEPKEPTPEPKELTPEPKEPSPEPKEPSPEPKESSPEPEEPSPEPKEPTPEPKEPTPEPKEKTPETEDKHVTEQFLEQARETRRAEEKQSTPELLEEALREMGEEQDIEEEEDEEEDEEEEIEPEKSTVKVLGMETTAHALDGGAWPAGERAMPPPQAKSTIPPEEVKSIFLPTEIPQQSRVLVADFAEHRADSPKPAKNASLIVSGKMTLSLIQEPARDTPDRDLESTFDEYTTASAITQPIAGDKEEHLSDEEIEEEIEIEEIEEEVEVEEEEEEEK